MNKDEKELIKELCEGYSTQSKTANQFWLVLILASIIAFTGKIDENKLIELPFDFGRVNTVDFYSIIIILISIIIIAFTSALIQTIRTRMLIQKAVENINENDRYLENIHIQDYIDSLLTPTYNRVAPISQYLLGKNQFFERGNRKNKILNLLATMIYIIYKISTFIFMYFIPLIAINNCFRFLNMEYSLGHLGQIGILKPMITPVVILGVLSMLILLVGDLKYIVRVIRRINQ